MTKQNSENREKDLRNIESKLHKELLLEREKFKKIAEQVVHDIRSPLASLQMLVSVCDDILPEEYRVALHSVATNIGDVANSLISKYVKFEDSAVSPAGVASPVLISTLILQILTEKKYQYKDSSIKLDHKFNHAANFAFINGDPVSLRMMISKILHNIVESLGDAGGVISIDLEADKEAVNIKFKDNSKTVSPTLVDKINSKSENNKNGEDAQANRISQIREILENNNGSLSITSKAKEGTVIVTTFPRVGNVNWIADVIDVRDHDLVVILDDDASIHGAWSARFESVLSKNPSIQLKHFEFGQDVIDFCHRLSPEDKERLLLLTDYELLKQRLNGLQVVEECQFPRSILVTSHYANKDIFAEACRLKIKILPKSLASEVKIAVHESPKSNSLSKKTDAVIVDDNQVYVRMLVRFAFAGQTVVEYQDPYSFLEDLFKYPKDVRICIDNHFVNSNITGTEIAKLLHEQGYKNLFLLSGKDFNIDEIPKYLAAISKDDLEGIKRKLDKRLVLGN